MTETVKDELDAAIAKSFQEVQAKLPPEDRCATKAPLCSIRHDGYACTKARGHVGDHIAHGSHGYVITRWPSTNDGTPHGAL